MAKNTARVSVVGFTALACAAVAFPGTAAATEQDSSTPSQVAAEHTVSNTPEQPAKSLDTHSDSHADSHAPMVNSSDSRSDTAHASVLSLPLLTPLVNNLTDSVSKIVTPMVNTLDSTLQELVGGQAATTPPPADHATAPEQLPVTGQPANPPSAPSLDAPTHSGTQNVGISNIETKKSTSNTTSQTSTNEATQPALGEPAPLVPQQEASAGQDPHALAENTGSPQAVANLSQTQNRLPILLAMVALIIAGAALLRTWLRRKVV